MNSYRQGQHKGWALACLLLLACAKSNPPQAPIYDVNDPNVDEVEEKPSLCGLACKNLRDLQCPEGFKSKSGHQCTPICKNAQPYLAVECAIESKTVEALRACHPQIRCGKIE